jgi:hypothetical protein
MNYTIKTLPQVSQPRGQLKASPGPSSPVQLSRHSSISTLNNAAPPYSPYTPRRAAPPPPPPSRSSDRSSILSTQSFSSHSSHSYQQPPPRSGAPSLMLKTKRPTPVPLAARKRYEAVFINNVLQQRKAQAAKETSTGSLLSPPSEVARNRRAAGWRGLSVDLIVDPQGPTINGAQNSTPQSQGVVDEAASHDKLEGAIVKLIWKKSGLDSSRLAEVWYVTSTSLNMQLITPIYHRNECDLAGQGALSLDCFVKGMWRIDEELRRTQAQMHKSNGIGLYRHQSIRSPSVPNPAVPPKLPPRYKDILR